MIELIRTLSIEQKISQLFIIGIGGPEVDAETALLLDTVSPGGICLFARNIKGLDQTRGLTDDLRNCLPVVPILAIDQEGGLVDRLRRVLSPMPAADQIHNVEDARWLATVISESLLALGLNMDFAPVVDVMGPDRHGPSNGLTSRTFGTTKEETTELAGEFLSVLQSKGIVGCLKHFPGLGASTVDSHEELPVVNVTEEVLFSTDLFPYKRLITSGDVNAVMVGHAAFPDVSMQETDQHGNLLPSSLSFNFVTRLIRNELNYDGLVITDDLEMGAIIRNYGIGDACIRAIAAGADMLAICADPSLIKEGYRSLLQAVRDGEISLDRIDESLKRIAKVKELFATPPPFSLENLTGLSNEIEAYSSLAVRT